MDFGPHVKVADIALVVSVPSAPLQHIQLPKVLAPPSHACPARPERTLLQDPRAARLRVRVDSLAVMEPKLYVPRAPTPHLLPPPALLAPLGSSLRFLELLCVRPVLRGPTPWRRLLPAPSAL